MNCSDQADTGPQEFRNSAEPVQAGLDLILAIE